MNREDSRIPIRNQLVRSAPGFIGVLQEAELDSMDSLASRRLGDVVTERRSSWVRRTTVGTINVYIKTYDYPTPRDRWRGIGRTTFCAPSRARREWDALDWLGRNGFPGPRPLLVAEQRRFGFLRQAVLATEAWTGMPADQALAEAAQGAERATLIEAIEEFVRRLHARGFRDRNLDPRNIITRRDAEGWSLVKIDSPRWRRVRPGTRGDRLEKEDWARLRRGLRQACGEVEA